MGGLAGAGQGPKQPSPPPGGVTKQWPGLGCGIVSCKLTLSQSAQQTGVQGREDSRMPRKKGAGTALGACHGIRDGACTAVDVEQEAHLGALQVQHKAAFTDVGLERQGLRHLHRKPVDEERRGIGVGLQRLLDQGDGDVPWHDVPLAHDGLNDAALFRPGDHFVAEDVAGDDVLEAKFVHELCALLHTHKNEAAGADREDATEWHRMQINRC